MRYPEHELSIINMLYSLKKKKFTLSPYLLIRATSPEPPLSSVPKVAVVGRFKEITRNELSRIREMLAPVGSVRLYIDLWLVFVPHF